MHEACQQLARWRSDLPQAAGLSMSVNVSVRQLQDASLIEDVESALRETGLDPGSLILELTESAVVEDRGSVGDAAAAQMDVGEEQERRRRVAVDLVEDPNAVARSYVALFVGIAGARLLSRFRCDDHGRLLLMKSRRSRLTLTGSRTGVRDRSPRW